MVGNDEDVPAEPDGSYGWIYKPFTKTVKIDWPGTDTQGKLYYDY